MEVVYLTLFIIGVAYAVLSVIFGDIFDIQFELGAASLPIISPTTIAAFATVFGGSGYYLSANTGIHPIVIAGLSIMLSLLVTALLFFFVVLPLHNSEKTAAYSEKEMIGKTAEVVTLIEPGSKGEIVYEQGGSRLSAPASSHGQSGTIRQGELVVIVDVVSGTFIVEKL